MRKWNTRRGYRDIGTTREDIWYLRSKAIIKALHLKFHMWLIFVCLSNNAGDRKTLKNFKIIHKQFI